MNLTERHYSILFFVATYYVSIRTLIQAALFPTASRDGAVVRKILNELRHNGLINKCRGEVVFPGQSGASSVVYYSHPDGLDALASKTGDASWLSACCRTPTPQNLLHYLMVAQLHHRLDLAIALQNDVRIESWIGEHEGRNPKAAKAGLTTEAMPEEKATKPEDIFKLFTLLRETPRLVCNPDAGWEIVVGPYRRVMYLEFDRGTTAARVIAASKTPGFVAMAEQQQHKKLFPNTTFQDFSVLSVSLTPQRRDLLRQLIAKRPGAKLWRFVSWTDWVPSKLLFEPIIYTCDGGPMPLVRKPTGGEK